jgi:predicted DNA-binding transcriptional regulator YafY
VCANASIETIVLKFSASRAPYVTTKPIHHSQKNILQDEDGRVIVQLSVMPDRELESVILGSSCDVKVVQPISLRCKMNEIIKRIVQCYEL